MLTEKEKEWLVLRELRHFETGYYMSSFKHEGKTWYSFSVYTDWKAAAEFEARVAAQLTAGTSWYFYDENCHHQVSLKKNRFLRLKHARLAVEEEMQ